MGIPPGVVMNAASQARPAAIVTGASEGIGAELARVFAAGGHDVVLVARRRDRLEALAREIAATGRPQPLVVALDLARPDAPAELAEALTSAGIAPAFLVNNAGYGTVGPFADGDIEPQLGMIDLNIRALTALTHRFLPQIVAARGGILNVASIAAFAPGPGMAVYYASKAYVLSFSEALAEEVAKQGVRVTALCPGPVVTGFQARAGFDSSMLKSMGPAVLSARVTAQAGYDGLMAGRRVVIPGTANRALVRAMTWIPHAILLPQLLARQSRRSATRQEIPNT